MRDCWLWNGEPLPTDFDPAHWRSFLYLITHIPSGKLYIGRKTFWFYNKKRGILMESDWADYWGSSKHLRRHIEEVGRGEFKREILELFTCGWEAHVTERDFLFQIEDWDRFYNSEKCLEHFKKKPRK